MGYKILNKFGGFRWQGINATDFLAIEISKLPISKISKIVASVASDTTETVNATGHYARLIVIEGKISKLADVPSAFDLVSDVDLDLNYLLNVTVKQDQVLDLDFFDNLRSTNERGLSVILTPLFDVVNNLTLDSRMFLSVFGTESAELGEIKATFS